MSKTDSLINELVNEAAASGFRVACNLMRVKAKLYEHEDAILDCLGEVINDCPEYALPDTSKEKDKQ